MAEDEKNELCNVSEEGTFSTSGANDPQESDPVASSESSVFDAPEGMSQSAVNSEELKTAPIPTETTVDDAKENLQDNAPDEKHGDIPVQVKEKKTGPSRRSVVVGIVGCCIAVVAIAVFAVISNMQAQERAKAEAYNEYVDSCSAIVADMLNGAAQAETACNTISNVWYSAIFADSQAEWDADIQRYYSTDFNESLTMLFSDPTFSSTQTSIASVQSKVESDLRKLNNPPEGCEGVYDEIKELYSSFMTLTDLAVNPSGSYQSFTDSFQEADADCIAAYNVANASIPEKMEIE